MYGTLQILEPDGDQISVELTREVVTIGRAQECDITLADSETSREHVQIRCQESGCTLVDLGSANGTTVRGQPIPPNRPVALQDKIVFVIGRTRVRFLAPEKKVVAAKPAPSPEPPVEKPPVHRPPPIVAVKEQATPEQAEVAVPPPPPPPPPPVTVKAPVPGEPPVPVGLPARASSYLEHLPSIFSQDDFSGRFLLIFEHLLLPVDRQIDHLAQLFDPRMTPGEWLPWLASWVDLVLDETWPEKTRRELIRSAVELYQWRGTAQGLKAYLRIYTGVTPEIFEPISRLDLSKPLDARGQLAAHSFVVTLHVANPETIDRDKVIAIIEAEKPAHAAYQLRIEKAQ